MSTIKRYDEVSNYDSDGLLDGTMPSEDGEFVLFSDHEAEVEKLRRDLARVRKRLSAFQSINVGQAIDRWMKSDGSRPLMEVLADENMDIQEAAMVPYIRSAKALSCIERMSDPGGKPGTSTKS